MEGLKLERIFEGLHARGPFDSDDRLVEVLIQEGGFNSLMVDLPLSVPPCVRCTRQTCPGKLSCEDESVAYLLSLNERLKAYGLRRKKSVSPQTQRVWDLEYRLSQLKALPDRVLKSPSSYAQSLALATRGMTLKRRFASIPHFPELKETNVELATQELLAGMGKKTKSGEAYRDFSRGRGVRESTLIALQENHFIQTLSKDNADALIANLALFSAFITALVCGLEQAGLTDSQPAGLSGDEGWVYLPRLKSERILSGKRHAEIH